ncbi:Com family DNA-binding transcriptional regulator, partial [Salmonella enterica subsp. enterica]|nr:Com family DNA-binding transcriptional regulator [Salmonella enterica subsp. enterica]
ITSLSAIEHPTYTRNRTCGEQTTHSTR